MINFPTKKILTQIASLWNSIKQIKITTQLTQVLLDNRSRNTSEYKGCITIIPKLDEDIKNKIIVYYYSRI